MQDSSAGCAKDAKHQPNGCTGLVCLYIEKQWKSSALNRKMHCVNAPL